MVGLTVLSGGSPALAADGSAGATWTAATPTVFGVGDSLFMQCGETLGVGSRSLGIIGWGSGTSQDMRRRLTSTASDWPYMTEPSHAEELADFRNASTWVIGLGTNDLRPARVSPAGFQANVDWFMQQAAGRPVLWFNLYHAQYASRTAVYNQILADAAQRWSNLRILDWHGYVTAHPDALHADGIHLASYQACREGRFALIQAALPAVDGQAPDPEWTDPAPLTPDPNPVTVEYQRRGGPTGVLGAATGPVECEHRRDGCVQFYAHGGLAWSSATGVRVMTSAVTDTWRTYAETGMAGYPAGSPVCGFRAGGCRQQFEKGWMYWSSSTPAREVTVGPVLTEYLAAGAQNGALGYPTGYLYCGLDDTGCTQNFAGGSIYWSAATGAHRVTGPVRARWSGLGAERGVLGYPTIGTVCGLRAGGCGQHFQDGSIYWSSATGARVSTLTVRARYRLAGAQNGSLGYPTMDTTCSLRGGGCGQTFQGGSIFATSRTAPAYVVSGAILTMWVSRGGVNGGYGYPVSEQVAVPGGYAQRFQGGTLTYRNGRVV